MIRFNFKNKITQSSPFPFVIFNNFLDYKICKKLCAEIQDYKNYDDIVMNGRYRVNKGSDHFAQQLKHSLNLKKLYSQFNKFETFNKFKKFLNNKNNTNFIFPSLKKTIFSKNNFGRQKFELFSFLRETKFVSCFFKQILNLDIDFSKSKRGYFRAPHRDRDTRIISFLIYLNSFNKKYGGQLEIFATKKNAYKNNNYPRFPKKNTLIKIMSLPPRVGQLVVFLSTPNSYHGVSKFLSNKKNRVFIYGSYSMDRKVSWKIDN